MANTAISSHQQWRIFPDALGSTKCDTSLLPIKPRATPSTLETATYSTNRKQRILIGTVEHIPIGQRVCEPASLNTIVVFLRKRGSLSV
jgi:hypothetical protein